MQLRSNQIETNRSEKFSKAFLLKNYPQSKKIKLEEN